MNKTIYIANDHGGYEMKKFLLPLLEEEGWSVCDLGSDSTDIVCYPEYGSLAAQAVSEGRCDRAILICSTGIGMSILANKFKGVRASLCTDEHMGKMTREHNDSNILCLGGNLVSLHQAQRIVKVWLETEYIGGRHEKSLNLIREVENRY